MIHIGIDPGVTTGFAIWDGGAFTEVTSLGIVDAMLRLQIMAGHGVQMTVTFEDARLRGGKRSGRSKLTPEEIARLQGAGSIRRESGIWAEFLDTLKIPYRAVSPQAKGAKMNAAQFAKLTGWKGRTNEHARDAAMLVWKPRGPQLAMGSPILGNGQKKGNQ